MEECAKIVTEIRAERKHSTFFLAGDFNLPDINGEDHSPTGNAYAQALNHRLIYLAEDLSLDQMVNFNTRKDNTLDLFFTSHPSLLEKLKSLPPLGKSDHDIVLIDTSLTPSRTKPVKRKIFQWAKANKDAIHMELHEFQDDITKNKELNTDSLWEAFKTLFDRLVMQYVPSKMSSNKYRNPWTNRTVTRLSRRKSRAHRKAKQTRHSRDWERYKHLSKSLQRECRKAHNTYVNDIICGDMKQNSKKLWTYLKSKKQDTTGIAPLQHQDGLLRSDSETKAELLNDQFQSVYTQEDTDNIPDLGPSTYQDMEHIKICPRGVHKLLISLKPHKASGPDNIPSTFAIVPIYKKGDKHKASNYRPVSLTSIACKVLEHIVHSAIMDHYERNKILADEQHGFRARRSCETQLLQTIQDIADGMSEGDQVDAVLLDFSKAFDKVPHKRLMYKLDHYGIRGKTHEWIQDFLTERKQHVLLEGKRSTTADVISGVPQGTVLGPLLFLTFINDMPQQTKSEIRLFADDSLLLRRIRSPQDTEILQNDLTALEKWEKDWQMEFNPNKCTVIHITT